jgi:hypothetical protein
MKMVIIRIITTYQKPYGDLSNLRIISTLSEVFEVTHHVYFQQDKMRSKKKNFNILPGSNNLLGLAYFESEKLKMIGNGWRATFEGNLTFGRSQIGGDSIGSSLVSSDDSSPLKKSLIFFLKVAISLATFTGTFSLTRNEADIVALNKASRLVLEALMNGPSPCGTTGLDIKPTGLDIERSLLPFFPAINN